MAKLVLASSFISTVTASSLRSSEFDSWATLHGKKYASPEERAFRRGVFAATAAQIAAHQARFALGEETFSMAINKFSDLTHAEFLASYVGGKKKAQKESSYDAAAFAAAIGSTTKATSIDWRDKGAVTPVKDQGQCGSCWAFGSTVATEGATFVGSGKLISLSEQQFVSCDKADGNAGCNGGDQLPALQWLAKQPGQCTEAGYPYTSGGGKDGKCETTCAPAAKISKATEITAFNTSALELALSTVPVSLSVDASANFWQSYSGGVITSRCKCSSDSCLDHGVGGVGYGTDSSAGDYYIVKNSWAADWGLKGYILLGRDEGGKYGKGGIW
jgi:C1A family cysteine protease